MPTVVLPDELAALPPPELIEELNYETRLALFVTRLVTLMAAADIEYDVDQLEFDPAKILLEVATYVDQNLRQRINEALRSNLLPYAYGADLDLLGNFYDTPRLANETDDTYRRRIVVSIRGRSTGGTEPRYRAVALAADPRVADASVYKIGKSPIVHVAVFSRDAGGVADQALLNAVSAALNAPAVRMVSDEINVHPAIRQTINVVVDAWLLPEASDTLIATMETALRTAWTRDGVMGRDLTPSYIGARMMLDGVQDVRVTTPAVAAVAAFNEVIAIGTVTINNRGRAF